MFLLFLGYSSSAVITLIRMIEETRLLPTGSIGNPGAQSSHLSSVYDAQLGSAGTAIFNNIPTTPGLYWDDLKGDAHCLAYGIRRYTAHLRNVPFLANRTRACKETAIQINGLDLRSPDECEIKWLIGVVKGHWNISSQENDCTPVWGKFTDKGCVKKAPRKRLFRSRLWNVKKGENRKLLCETAPAYVAGIYRSMPDACEDQGFWGTYGSWIIEDPKC
ncbi:hypothetical protein Ac2012v2_004249 [Leucoagaricus gongylophorus]